MQLKTAKTSGILQIHHLQTHHLTWVRFWNPRKFVLGSYEQIDQLGTLYSFSTTSHNLSTIIVELFNWQIFCGKFSAFPWPKSPFLPPKQSPQPLSSATPKMTYTSTKILCYHQNLHSQDHIYHYQSVLLLDLH